MIYFLKSLFVTTPKPPQSVALITQQFHSMATELREHEASMQQKSVGLGEEIDRLSDELAAAQAEEHLASQVRMKILTILT